ncbi:MAG: hypothetical protein Q4P14_01700 [Methanobacteriaceae archaeon]|nr:hypothetical protein [Methanobacteriaceae archaeon]
MKRLISILIIACLVIGCISAVEAVSEDSIIKIKDQQFRSVSSDNDTNYTIVNFDSVDEDTSVEENYKYIPMEDTGLPIGALLISLFSLPLIYRRK